MRRLSTIVVVAFLATSCAGGDGSPGATTVPPATSPVTTSAVTTDAPTGSPATTSPVGEGPDGPIIDPASVAAPSDVPSRAGTVVRIFDGDSLEIEIDGSILEIRMVGMNAPEGDECHGEDARATLVAIAESAGSVLDVALSDQGSDQFDRSLAYLSAEGVDINALMIATGNAIAIQTGHERQAGYLSLMEEAVGSNAGLWRPDVCGSPAVELGDVTVAGFASNPEGRDDENLNGEYVTLLNRSAEPVDLADWVLRDESTANRYTFDNGAVLHSGEEITVFVGCGADSDAEVYWCSDIPVWSNGGDTIFVLDPNGNIIDVLVYGAS